MNRDHRQLRLAVGERVAGTAVESKDGCDIARPHVLDFFHAESRRRQYQMAEWVQQIGWREERIIRDRRRPGTTAAVARARSGFDRLAKAVGRGEARIVMSLEVSRLARNTPTVITCWSGA